jgi:Apea-like HEPN
MSGPLVTARVINSATHALVLQDVVVDNTDPWSRVLGRFRGESEVPYERIDIAVRAIRIVVPEPFGYAQVLLSPHDWSDHWKLDLPVMHPMATVRKYPPSLDDKNHGDPVTIIPPETMQDLPEAHAALLRGDGRLNLAARRLDIARYRLDTDDTIIDCAVGLEALLGGDRTELSHRIATRAAVLLRSKFKAEMVYQSVRKIYERRSEIVHGSQRAKSAQITFGDATFSTHAIALWVLREVVSSAVADHQPIDKQALDAMALDAIQQTAPSASVNPPAEEASD